MSHAAEVKAVGMSFRHVKNKLKKGDRVKLVPEPDNKYDPNALQIQSLEGEMLGYVGKKDKMRSKFLQACQEGEVTLPVLVANYYKEGEEKLWEDVEEDDLTQLWLRAFSKTPLEDNTFTAITSFTGEQVLWSEYQHVCIDQKGNELLGGSTYASMQEKEFDSENIAKKWAKKNDHYVIDVLAFWSDLGQISMDYGTAVHKGMELYSKHHGAFGDDALPRVPHLREAVKKFLEVSDFNRCTAEPLLTDVEMGMSGWVDNLRFTGEKSVIVEDFKTNTFKDDEAYQEKWKAKLQYYKHQLDFYGTILENFGYKVEGLVIWHWHKGKWDKHPLKYRPVSKYKREATK